MTYVTVLILLKRSMMVLVCRKLRSNDKCLILDVIYCGFTINGVKLLTPGSQSRRHILTHWI